MVAETFTCMEMPGGHAGPASRAAAPADTDQLEAFVDAIERQDAAVALRLCEGWQGRQHSGVGDAYFGLVLPAIRLLERRWQDDSIVYERIVQAFLTLHRVLRSRIAHRQPDPLPGREKGRVCLTLVEGAAHDFGLLIVADAFQTAGWHVSLHLADGQDVLLRILRQTPVDILGIGVGNDRELAQVSRLADSARRISCRPGLQVVVGGCAIAPPREQYAFLGVDHVAFDAQDALVWAEAVRSRAQGREGHA